MAPPAAIESMSVEVYPETDTSTFTTPDRLTVEKVAKRRAASGILVAGVAASADLELYKGRTSHLHKGLAKRWDHRLSHETLSRGGSSLKEAANYLKTPGLISLGGGLPSSEYFPFQEISVKAPRPGYLGLEQDAFEETETLAMGMHDMALGKSGFDLGVALNYGQGHGAPQLLRWMVEHTEIVHNPPYQDWSCTMTVGSTAAWEMTLRMFCKPGDFIISEQYSYPAAIEAALPMGVRCAGVDMDAGGMIPSSLDEVLTNWNPVKRGGPKPFLVYTVPTGQNPTGSTISIERRRQIYAVCQKHDLYIFEDEPYYFLQLQPYTGEDSSPVPAPQSHAEFLHSLIPSFLSIDIDGRVMRADSFSKVVAPGSRLGWITASEQICNRFRTHSDVCTQGPSGFSQVILFKLLDETWGHPGYLDWLMHIRIEYTKRRDVMLAACEHYLPKDIVSWTPPTAGMFHWLQIDYKKHPGYLNGTKSLVNIEEDIFLACVRHGTLLMKGGWFCADKSAKRDTLFFRATYAAAQFDKIEEAIKRFGNAVRDEFGKISYPKGVNGHVNGHSNGYTNGHSNAIANGHCNGVTNGYTNGHSNAIANGHGNGVTNGYTNGHAKSYSNGHSNGINGIFNGKH
ncbi:Putative aminotransferase, class I/classII, pyridoxal phosphate-dependent transferase, major [Septoria linicola]|uniref:aromatic-amino-acid transaminase n=1 Tax=Septoria linicola TaxID=215465 RepID=A0A9Q9AYI4_9PEZI|nr:putative aminotransferase, class I/classII, pyridoxal phosphate-dependent transferase, major [Septoria linicola]USW54388.1 Putative aminotransferase, class I/classII, pyridoxal phosphate-dependent transferase, major [Septoria linicola]